MTVPTLFIRGKRDVFVRHKVEKAWEAIATGNPTFASFASLTRAICRLDDAETVVAEIERFLAAQPRSGAEAVA